VQQLDGQALVQLTARSKRADPAGQIHHRRAVPGQDRSGELAEWGRDAVGQGGDGTEVQHAQAAAGQQQEVAGVQVGVHPAGARGRRVNGVPEQPGGPVRRVARAELAPALGKQVRAPVEQRGQAYPFEPSGDEDPRGGRIYGGDLDPRPAGRLMDPGGASPGDYLGDMIGECHRDLALDPALADVAQLLHDAQRELVGQPGHVQPGEAGHDPRQQPGLPQIGPQRIAHAGVLHLDRHVDDPAVIVPPSPAVHLADRRCGQGRLAQGHQPVPPVRAESGTQIGRDDPVSGLGWHRRRRVGEPPERRAVGRGDLLRQHGFEHRHRLA
jgi:hypothetical protein